MVKNRMFGSKATDVVIVVVLIFTAALCIVPIINTLAVSLSSQASVAAGKVFLWPVNVSLSSYQMLLEDSAFFHAAMISVMRVLVGCPINIVLSALTAFPLSRENQAFRGRNVYIWILLFTMLFSGGLIPTYMTVHALKLTNTFWSLILPGAVPVFSVILLMNYFRGIPKELEEAALIDGIGPFQLLIYIFIPVAMPCIATITLFSIVGHWNSFFDGLIYMSRPRQYPLQTYIQQLVVVSMQEMTLFDPELLKRAAETSTKTLNAAKIFVSMVPILLIYPFMQRFFVKGIVMGSVKE